MAGALVCDNDRRVRGDFNQPEFWKDEFGLYATKNIFRNFVDNINIFGGFTNNRRQTTSPKAEGSCLVEAVGGTFRICANANSRLVFRDFAWIGCTYEIDVGEISGVPGN